MAAIKRFGQATATRVIAAMALVVALIATMSLATAPQVAAADPTATMQMAKTADVGGDLTPGTEFLYTITVTCSSVAVGGCENYVLTDPLPQYIEPVGDPTVDNQPSTVTISPDNVVTVDVNQALGGGKTGLKSGDTLTVTIPVKLADDAPATINGKTITNTATSTADNATQQTASADVTPVVTSELGATTTKTIEPSGAAAKPGTTADVTLTGRNTSNTPVHELVVQDPVDPAASPNPFTYLGVTTPLGDVTMPKGADQVVVWAYVNGQWVEGEPGPPATLPAGVDPSAVQGLRYVFTDTTGDGIAAGATATIPFTVQQRANVTELTGPVTVKNDAQTTVTTTDGQSKTSDPADDTYVITPPELDAAVTKKFDPATVHAGDPSTVTIGATNSSNVPVDSLTIKEPSGATNPFEGDNPLTFAGFTGGVVWPSGATAAAITYTGPGCSDQALTTTTANTLPEPPTGCQPTGFTVTFTGTIEAGAEATLPFTVETDADQSVDSLTHNNQVSAQTGLDGATSDPATADSSLVTLADRIATSTTKRITPNDIPAVPGQDVTTSLTGTIKAFPDSTVDAQRMVVQDPEDPSVSPNFFDTFRPTSVDSTEINECSQLTVNYWNGTAWVPVPGMTDLQGPQRFSGKIPASVDAHGLQFVYTPGPGCTGFPPGTSFSPNFTSNVRPGVPNEDATVSNCAGTDGSAPTVSQPAHSQGCADVDLNHVTPGEGDLIDKSWDDPANVAERSGDERGATLRWSTGGFSNFEKVVISDVPNPQEPIQNSVFDSFDLVRIDPISAADDPLLKYDRVASVELYINGQWVEASGDPCPAACDGTFPGYTLTASERADATAFRLTYEESDTNRTGAVGTPVVGSGVARSSGDNRTIHPVFALRDVTRHTPAAPVLSTSALNTDQAGLVSNTAGADAYFPGDTTPSYSDQASDRITIVPANLQVDLAKTWEGGPLGVPAPGTAAEKYPTSEVTLAATNKSLSRLDTLTITEPTGTSNPFDTFDLIGFTTITAPAEIGATDVTITVHYAGGAPDRTFTRQEALDAPATDFEGAVGFDTVYTGRINSATDQQRGAHNTATVGFDTRLRPTHRADGTPVTAPATIANEATTTGKDLVDYPSDTKTATDKDTASIDLVPGALTVQAGKSIKPASQVEGDNSPVTVTLSGQPKGPARTVQMIVQDDAPTFWNQYDFTGFSAFSFTNPINQVQVDALTGGTWSVVGGEPVLTGATWKTGTPGTALALPAGVTAPQVQGLRFTFTRADGKNWENPSTPKQNVSFKVTRRATLNTGGPVLTDQKGNAPAPGETQAGRASDVVDVDATSSALDGDGNPIVADDTANAHIDYVHLNNAVQITKNPKGNTYQPGVPFTYVVTVKNTGKAPIENPVIVDAMPTDADGAQLVFNPDVSASNRYTYTLTPPSEADTALPTTADDVTVAQESDAQDSPTSLTFTFPDGSILQPGETYSIAFSVLTRPGLKAKTTFTNKVGITADRPWDSCSGTLDPSTGACTTTAANTIGEGAAIGVSKRVKAEDSDTLGVITDPALTKAVDCHPDAAGFYGKPCIPVTKPGGDITWRTTYVNTGNESQTRIVAIDRLPKPGDTGSTNSLARGSQWRPIPSGRPTLVSGNSIDLSVYYTTSDNVCQDDLVQANPGACPTGAWTLWAEGTTLPENVLQSITAFQFVYAPNKALIPPLGGFSVDIPQTAPALSPTAGADTVAFNTTGARAEAVRANGTVHTTLTTEPPRVGVSLATGPLQVEKVVTGPAAENAPDTFSATLHCTSVGVEVDLGDKANLTLTPNTPVTVKDLPYNADCWVTESGDGGQTSSSSTHVTVTRDEQNVPLITLTNVYENASLVVSKTVDTTATDQNGAPLTYGPFQIAVECTFLDKPVYATGYSADKPMQVTLKDGESHTFTGLSARSICTVTESDYTGASVSYETTTGEDSSATGTGTLVPDGSDGSAQNTTKVTNTFDSGSLLLTKKVEGDAASTYGAGPFTFHLVCTLDDHAEGAEQPRTVYEADLTLGGDEPLQRSVDHIATGAQCTVSETDNAGATSSSLDPADGTVTIGSSTAEIATVTATNTFDAGTLAVTKKVSGAAADYAPASFPAEVTCTADGKTLPGFPRQITITPGETTTVDALVGASCVVRETGQHGATGVTYDPADPDNPDQSKPVVIGPAEQDPVQVGITNEYRAGGLQIFKQVDGPGAPEASVGPFVFSVVCTFDGKQVYDHEVTLTGDGTSTVLKSEILSPLPVGAQCVVRETGNGGADSTPAPVTVTIPNVDDSGTAQVVVAGFTNEFSAGTIALAKDLAGDNAESARDKVFTIQLTCQLETPDGERVTLFSDPVQIKGGEVLTPTDADGNELKLPRGTHCFAEETDSGGATSVEVSNGSYDDAVVVGTSGELQKLTITVTNTFTKPTPPPTTPPPTTPPPTTSPSPTGTPTGTTSPAPSGTTPPSVSTGGHIGSGDNSWALGVAGIAFLIAAGAAGLLVSRRRKGQ
ncbi:DUF5979 domain-containing protein [Branchiibius sp. NY16-3462-2]|uniref:DUF5979 domain-containing protein n=1 Tax=Branchiibius sp. NY16-3462-2 TaxID=1807500 RepID=UPI000794F850|nr:DUF5979 domain-containing protein [Branchiibius sp. NY16-3462-2]KYH43414.1 hypothetical protein AZH51_16780 [Branchiibius sp. NY16-3462-2]